MRRLIMSRLIWIYAVCKNLLLSPMAVKELRVLDSSKFILMATSLGTNAVVVMMVYCFITSNSVFFFFFFFLEKTDVPPTVIFQFFYCCELEK